MTDLDTVLAKQAVADVCYRYALALDTKDWATLSTCFTPDAQADLLEYPTVDGYAAIEDLIRNALSPFSSTQHLIGNVLAEVNGDEADSVCYLQAQHVKPGTEGGDNFTIAGRYVDHLVRTPDGWRIKHRRLIGMWTGGNPAVVGR